jgi:hypothetical protein
MAYLNVAYVKKIAIHMSKHLVHKTCMCHFACPTQIATQASMKDECVTTFATRGKWCTHASLIISIHMLTNGQSKLGGKRFLKKIATHMVFLAYVSIMLSIQTLQTPHHPRGDDSYDHTWYVRLGCQALQADLTKPLFVTVTLWLFT